MCVVRAPCELRALLAGLLLFRRGGGRRCVWGGCSSRRTSFLLQPSKSEDQPEVRSFCGFCVLLPSSLRSPLMSSAPPLCCPSLCLSFHFCVLFFLPSEGLNFDARPQARSPLYIPLSVLSSSPAPLFLLHRRPPGDLSHSVEVAAERFGRKRGKKTGSQAVFDQDDCSFISPSAT